MLAPRDITNKRFEKGAFGYKADEVDAYMSLVAEELARVLNERNEFEKKMNALADKLEEYRKEESSLSAVLLGAQKLGDSIVKEAKNKAELMIRDAGIKSDKMLEGTHRQLEREKHDYAKLQKEVASFKASVLSMYKTHLELVAALPEGGESKLIDSRENTGKLESGSQPSQAAAFSDEEDMAEVADAISLEVELDRGEQAMNEGEQRLEEGYSETTQPPQGKRKGFLPDLEEREEPQKTAFTFNENYAEYDAPYGSTDVIETPAELPAVEEQSNRSSKFGELRFGEGYDLIREDDQPKKKRRRR